MYPRRPLSATHSQRPDLFVRWQLVHVVQRQPGAKSKLSIVSVVMLGNLNRSLSHLPGRFVSGRQRHSFAVLEKRSVETVESRRGVLDPIQLGRFPQRPDTTKRVRVILILLKDRPTTTARMHLSPSFVSGGRRASSSGKFPRSC